MVEYLRSSVTHQQAEVTVAGDGLPVILIQTSRPKAKTVIEALRHLEDSKEFALTGADHLKASAMI